MKKKIMSILLITVIIFGLTGCKIKDNLKEKLQDNNKNRISSMYKFGNGYFIAVTGLKTKVFDIKGNEVFEIPKGYEVYSFVYDKYIVTYNDDYKSEYGYHIYNIETKEEVKLGEDINGIGYYRDKKYRASKTNHFIIIKVLGKTINSIDGSDKVFEYYKLDNTGLNKIDSGLVDTTYEIYSRKVNEEITNFKTSDGSSYAGDRNYFEWILYKNNGFFTVAYNGEYTFEPIEGDAIPNDGNDYSFVALIKDKYYVYDKKGNRTKELTYIPEDETVEYYYDGYIATRDKWDSNNINEIVKSSYHYYSPNGEEINLN